MPMLSKFERMKYSKKYDSIEGELKILNKGNGFVINELSDEKFFIKNNFLKGAMNGDRVRVSINTSRYGSFLRCRVEKIIKRKNKFFTAKIYKYKKQFFACIYPLQSKKIILKHLNINICTGDIVKIQIINWREDHKSAHAKVISLIARADDPDADYIWISRKYGIEGFNEYYTSKVDQNKYKNILENNLIKRKDLSQLRTFTIDPEDAKDFDDAISVIKRIHYTDLYIHIADVSIYVEENSKIDHNASERGNSYYFHEKTSHMLPEYLSTYICSLVPGKKRLALTVKIVLDNQCRIKSFDFFESTIMSDRKFHYKQVETIISGNKSTEGIFKDIQHLKLLTDKLRENRLSKDGFNLDLAERDFELDNNGNPIDSYEVERLQSHEMIEESMLLANTLAAKQIQVNQTNFNHFGIYRNHESVSMKNENFIKELIKNTTNNPINTQPYLKAREINNFLSQSSSSQRKGLGSIIIRKMQKANYSTKPLGHYGLGIETYTHFTSPIRRYSDIVAHRMVKGKFSSNNNIFSIIHKCNNGELRSQNAERDYKNLKGLKLLDYKKDDPLNGYITKIQRSRIIVNEECSGVDGIILKQHIPRGSYEFHKDMLYMRNKIGREEFRVGDEVSIKVASIDFISEMVYFYFDS